MPRCYILKKAHAQHNPIQPYGKRTIRNSKGKNTTTTTIGPNNATKRNIISNNNNNNSESCDRKNPHIRVAVIQVYIHILHIEWDTQNKKTKYGMKKESFSIYHTYITHSYYYYCCQFYYGKGIGVSFSSFRFTLLFNLHFTPTPQTFQLPIIVRLVFYFLVYSGSFIIMCIDLSIRKRTKALNCHK